MWPLKKTPNSEGLVNADERLILMDVIDALEAVRTSEQFLACTNGLLQRLLPHERLACGIGSVNGNRVRPYCVLFHNFPREYLDELRQPDGTVDSPLMQRWRAKREPVLVELERDAIGLAIAYVTRIKRY